MPASVGHVNSWSFFLRRDDVNLRNEWSNYTNFPYRQKPMPGGLASVATFSGAYGPGLHPRVNDSDVDRFTGFFETGPDAGNDNEKNILQTLQVEFDGKIREHEMSHRVFRSLQGYQYAEGEMEEDGIYVYHFGLNSGPWNYQPSGSMNMTSFKNPQLKMTTVLPQVKENQKVDIICDGETPITTTKVTWQKFDYSFDMFLFEERLNIISVMGGHAGKLYA